MKDHNSLPTMTKIRIFSRRDTRRIDEMGRMIPFVDLHYRTEDGRIGFVSIKAAEYSEEKAKEVIKKDIELKMAVPEEFEV